MGANSKVKSTEEKVSAITDALASLIARVWGFEAWASRAEGIEEGQKIGESDSSQSEQTPTPPRC